MFSHPDYDGHEVLLFTQDAASGLRALIAIHYTTLGPAFGGCRMYPYASEQHAMTELLRLSRGMTYKAAICELPYGGGKSIIADPRRDKTPALLDAMGRIIEGLGRPLHHRRRRGHNARGHGNHAGSDAPYRGGDGGRAASLARDRVRRVRGPACRRGGLPRPQRPGMPLCGYLSVAGGGIGGQ
jgi:Glu/Leu/Phe/Val dehydrogenase, dimerisation domain